MEIIQVAFFAFTALFVFLLLKDNKSEMGFLVILAAGIGSRFKGGVKQLAKINENKESNDISKLINSNDEPIVLTDASISELPIQEVKTEESELEQTKTLVDLRNRLNNIRQK